MSETPEGERRHSEAPAEGDPDADTSETRVHSQDPAEGPVSENADRVPPAGGRDGPHPASAG
jgi:hypothetical protein